jgi:hypothetical protein
VHDMRERWSYSPSRLPMFSVSSVRNSLSGFSTHQHDRRFRRHVFDQFHVKMNKCRKVHQRPWRQFWAR